MKEVICIKYIVADQNRITGYHSSKHLKSRLQVYPTCLYKPSGAAGLEKKVLILIYVAALRELAC